jgi:glucose-6-phosphate isomerase|tara:strand:- start:2171 stop:3394 length:1224 start_codon:yes stop_codon:yes gene_type:complete
MENIELTLHISHERSSNMEEYISDANAGSGKDDERWRNLWRNPMRDDHLKEISKLVQSLLPCKNLLVLGIGGSALGTRALHSALCCEESPAFFVLDNIDPATFQNTIKQIQANDPNLSDTVVAVISKSGETPEISALYMATHSAIPNATYVAITGESGTLRQYANTHGWDYLPVPEGVGGRFSVLSPVGLFPAAMCGIDIKELLHGAEIMDDKCRQLQDNPAAKLADGLVSAINEGFTTHVMMPYCDRLIQFAHWYVQLWAESLGKIDAQGKRVGPTPIAAIGATDQHSMLQLWREGPTDKIIGFLTVQQLPVIPLGNNSLGASQAWLCGETLGSLLSAEQIATERAVQDAGQGTWSLSLPSLTPFHIGQFIALWQDTVAIAGRLLQVNPYDQPGVEYGKKLTRNAF